MVALFELRRTTGDQRLPVPDHRHDEPVPALDGLLEVGEAPSHERRPAGDVRTEQDELAVGELDPLGDVPARREQEEFTRCGLTRVDDEVDAERLDLGLELGILDSGNLPGDAELGSRRTGEDVDGVGGAHGDQEVRIGEASLCERRRRCAVPVDDEAVDLRLGDRGPLGIGLDHHDVLALVRQLLREVRPHGARAHDHDSHG